MGTAISMVSVVFSFVMTVLAPSGSLSALVLLIAAAILIDAAITANLILGQRAIFSLPASLRARLNGLYIANIFIGGALGSLAAAWSYERGGWIFTAAIGSLFPLVALVIFATEWLTGFRPLQQS